MCGSVLNIYAIFMHLLEYFILGYVLIWPSLAYKYPLFRKFFIYLENDNSQPHKTLFVLCATTVLVGLYVGAFVWASYTKYKVLYYAVLIILSTLTKFQYEKLFYIIVREQKQTRYNSVKNDEFLNSNLPEKGEEIKEDLLKDIGDIYSEI